MPNRVCTYEVVKFGLQNMFNCYAITFKNCHPPNTSQTTHLCEISHLDLELNTIQPIISTECELVVYSMEQQGLCSNSRIEQMPI